MKNFLLLPIFLCLFASNLKAQTFLPRVAALDIIDSCSNTSGSLAYAWVAFENIDNSMSAILFWGDGTFDTFNININTSTFGTLLALHNYSTPGTYTITASLTNAAYNSLDTRTKNHITYCTTITGITYKRGDANCTFDSPTDLPILAPIQIEVRANNVAVDTFTATGSFYYMIPSPSFTAEYSLHPIANGLNLNLACPAGSSAHKFKLDTLYNANNHFTFGFDCGTAADFDLATVGHGMFRSVANSYFYPMVSNLSCLPQSGTFTVTLSPKYSYVSATVPPASVSGQTLTWNLSNIHVASLYYFGITLSPVGTLALGDTVVNTLNISPSTGDLNPANNTYIAVDTIRASYDPNDKHVSPTGDIEAGELLTYTIQFENLGNDTAFNIHVIDTLSANVDVNTFKLLHATHMVNTNVYQVGAHNIVRFEFANIQLPDASHPESNKGLFVYQVKAKNSLVQGNEVHNTAHIYFDINPAIVTNTTVNKIPTLSVGKTAKDGGFKVYPNPAKGTITLEVANGSLQTAYITNVLGQMVQSTTLQKGNNTVDISHLTAGMYYLSVSNSNTTNTVKLTVE